MEMKCGVLFNGRSEGSDRKFEFEVCQRDGRGAVVGNAILEVPSGAGEADGVWQILRLLLQPAGGEKATLELFYRGGDNETTVGAFAAALLREP
jgi:hypothetical protein